MPDNVQKRVKKLISDFYSKSNDLAYANLIEGKYAGWVSDFHISLKNNNEKISLNLKNEKDIFLLFVLASAWSRTDKWENAPFLVTYIKLKCKDNIEYWKNKDNIKHEKENRKENAKQIKKDTTGIEPPKKISFRKDIFDSINILAEKWSDIYKNLKESASEENYIGFMKFIKNIKGLGCGKNRMFIKIPLILRELRCQKIFNNIPGELCCVCDARVIKACREIGINIPKKDNSINYLVDFSKKIYSYFSDLYDIPLFAYEDICKE